MISQMAAKGFTVPSIIGASTQFRYVKNRFESTPRIYDAAVNKINRQVTTQKITPEDSYQILVAQRKLRPNSPHLTIYRPQLTWYLSILNRITGCIISGGMYVFGAAYLVAPLAGWHLESASIAAAFGAWPVIAKVATKFAIALPFTFHSFNGLRHLIWDTGKSFANATVIKTGWTVVGVSVVSALYLASL